MPWNHYKVKELRPADYTFFALRGNLHQQHPPPCKVTRVPFSLALLLVNNYKCQDCFREWKGRVNRPSIIQGRGTKIKAAAERGGGGDGKMPFRDSGVFNFNWSVICKKRAILCGRLETREICSGGGIIISSGNLYLLILYRCNSIFAPDWWNLHTPSAYFFIIGAESLERKQLHVYDV